MSEFVGGFLLMACFSFVCLDVVLIYVIVKVKKDIKDLDKKIELIESNDPSDSMDDFRNEKGLFSGKTKG